MAQCEKDHPDDQPEIYVSVDIEAAGPVPGKYSMLSLGASLVDRPSETFYRELRPINDQFVSEALQVSGLSMERLTIEGRAPFEVMTDFRAWVTRSAGRGRPIFVGFNASFDWAFVNWYFHVFLEENPFGIGGIDIKAYAMGRLGSSWQATSSSRLPLDIRAPRALSHNALDDAIVQGDVFSKLLAWRT